MCKVKTKRDTDRGECLCDVKTEIQTVGSVCVKTDTDSGECLCEDRDTDSGAVSYTHLRAHET